MGGKERKFVFRISDELYARIKKICEKYDLSMSFFVRNAILNALAEFEDENVDVLKKVKETKSRVRSKN